MRDDDRSHVSRNLALSAVAGQAGCATVVIVIAALLFGLWLDSQFGTRGPFTVLLVVLSIPVSLGAMLMIALNATRAITPSAGARRDAADQEPTEEE